MVTLNGLKRATMVTLKGRDIVRFIDASRTIDRQSSNILEPLAIPRKSREQCAPIKRHQGLELLPNCPYIPSLPLSLPPAGIGRSETRYESDGGCEGEIPGCASLEGRVFASPPPQRGCRHLFIPPGFSFPAPASVAYFSAGCVVAIDTVSRRGTRPSLAINPYLVPVVSLRLSSPLLSLSLSSFSLRARSAHSI